MVVINGSRVAVVVINGWQWWSLICGGGSHKWVACDGGGHYNGWRVAVMVIKWVECGRGCH